MIKTQDEISRPQTTSPLMMAMRLIRKLYRHRDESPGMPRRTKLVGLVIRFSNDLGCGYWEAVNSRLGRTLQSAAAFVFFPSPLPCVPWRIPVYNFTHFLHSYIPTGLTHLYYPMLLRLAMRRTPGMGGCVEACRGYLDAAIGNW